MGGDITSQLHASRYANLCRKCWHCKGFIVPLKIMSPRTTFPREICPLGQLSLGKTVPSLVKTVPLSYRYVFNSEH